MRQGAAIARALALVCVALWSGAACAEYRLAASQVSPVDVSMGRLAAILDQAAGRPYLDAYQQTTTDARGTVSSLAPVKIVQTDDPAHRYLGVFHAQVTPTRFATYAAYSNDLANWHTLGSIDNTAAGDYGSQPDIRILPDDSVLYAEEYDPRGSSPRIRVRYYGAHAGRTGLQAFIANPAAPPSDQKVLPHINAESRADGTPEFGHIEYAGAIGNSKIEITHHYFDNGERDIQAVGTLSDFNGWSDDTSTAINKLITEAGGDGKIGDRELFRVGPDIYEIVEAQAHPESPDDYGSWRLFLVNRTTNRIEELHPELLGGARSLGNPSVSFVKLPDGTPALVFTCFVFSQNSGSTPSGGHMYVYPLVK